MTPDAETDLFELRNYIAEVLFAPDTARSYIHAIREEIAKLKTAAKKSRPLDEEPWHSRGVRKILVKSFYVYYRIDEVTDQVYILNVIYSKRDQLKALKNLKMS